MNKSNTIKQDARKNSIPSFYKNSYVNEKYSVVENPEMKKENIYTDYDSTHHVRIMKNFDTPNYRCYDPLERKWIRNAEQKTFFLRCYLPKNKISHKDKKHRIQHLIVMFNGLNECSKFDFYDVMGAQFAEQGIASILLPTPFHLNRRIRNSKKKDARSMEIANWQPYEMPTDLAFDTPELYFYNFKRSIKEFEELIKRIRKPVLKDHGFFENYFVKNPEITIFGFSLGGLRALACFLKNPEKYHSCITFNTAVDIRRIRTKDLHLNDIVWKNTFDYIEKKVRKVFFMKSQKKYREILDFFRWLYLGERNSDLTTKLERNSHKYLSIQSGADTLFLDRTEMDGNIANPEHGLNRFVVAGVGHLPTMDLRWDNWLSKVGENIIHFIKGCKEVHWAHAELEKKIKDLISGTPFYKVIEKKPKAYFTNMDFTFEMFDRLKKEVKRNKKDPKHFIELYYISKAFYPKFSELLEKIVKPKK